MAQLATSPDEIQKCVHYSFDYQKRKETDVKIQELHVTLIAVCASVNKTTAYIYGST